MITSPTCAGWSTGSARTGSRLDRHGHRRHPLRAAPLRASRTASSSATPSATSTATTAPARAADRAALPDARRARRCSAHSATLPAGRRHLRLRRRSGSARRSACAGATSTSRPATLTSRASSATTASASRPRPPPAPRRCPLLPALARELREHRSPSGRRTTCASSTPTSSCSRPPRQATVAPQRAPRPPRGRRQGRAQRRRPRAGRAPRPAPLLVALALERGPTPPRCRARPSREREGDAQVYAGLDRGRPREGGREAPPRRGSGAIPWPERAASVSVRPRSSRRRRRRAEAAICRAKENGPNGRERSPRLDKLGVTGSSPVPPTSEKPRSGAFQLTDQSQIGRSPTFRGGRGRARAGRAVVVEPLQFRGALGRPHAIVKAGARQILRTARAVARPRGEVAGGAWSNTVSGPATGFVSDAHRMTPFIGGSAAYPIPVHSRSDRRPPRRPGDGPVTAR